MADTHKTKVVNINALKWDGTNLAAILAHVLGNANLKSFSHDVAAGTVTMDVTSSTLVFETDEWVIINADLTITRATDTSFTGCYEAV
jgi:hypothetical protein